MAGDDAEDRGGVADVRGKGADAVERGGKGDEAVARDAAVGWQHANDAAEAGRLANGASGVGAERGHGEVGRDGCGRASAGAAGNALRIDGIAHRAIGGVLIRGAHGKLVAVGFAEEHRARSLEPRNGRAVIRRPISLKDFGACG